MRVATSPALGVSGGAPLIMLDANAGPVIDRLPEAVVTRVAHHHLFTLATLASNGRDAGVATQGVIVTLTQELGRLGEHGGGDTNADPDQGTENLDVTMLDPLPRGRIGFFKTGQQGLDVLFTTPTLRPDEPEAREEQGNVRSCSFDGPGRHRQCRGPQRGENGLSIEPPDAMCSQELLDPLTGQARHLPWGGNSLEQCPKPSFIGCRNKFEHLREEAMKLVAEAVGEAAELVPQIVVHARVLTQFDDDGIVDTHPAEGRPIGAERGGQDERVAAIVLRSGHGVTIAEAIELLGVERVHVEAVLHERFHERPSRNFNCDAHPLRSAFRQVDEPFDEFPDGASGVSHTSLCLRTSVFIEDRYLVRLGRPIDADQPCVCLVLWRQWFPPFRRG